MDDKKSTIPLGRLQLAGPQLLRLPINNDLPSRAPPNHFKLFFLLPPAVGTSCVVGVNWTIHVGVNGSG
ncbi:hypothetical protein EG68_12151 [Paragonimus skrjabini miyazakii]|uniref:Uncharacterized protein n=1 Tax=Paragonimus skrjabini miyazakii TaxID=59628 RepID=A0A8S9YP38_9TREM|nr:hypothetical protein EG68_12151 [Paragonimus skrjabini miyazakii]